MERMTDLQHTIINNNNYNKNYTDLPKYIYYLEETSIVLRQSKKNVWVNVNMTYKRMPAEE